MLGFPHLIGNPERNDMVAGYFCCSWHLLVPCKGLGDLIHSTKSMCSGFFEDYLVEKPIGVKVYGGCHEESEYHAGLAANCAPHEDHNDAEK